MAKYQTKEMPRFMNIAKALSEQNRVRILMFLRDDELCLCQIIEMLSLTPSTVSKHMAILRDAGLVESRKEGRWHFYRLAGKAPSRTVRSACRWMEESLANDKTIQEDARRLKAVLMKDKKELCVHYKS